MAFVLRGRVLSLTLALVPALVACEQGGDDGAQPAAGSAGMAGATSAGTAGQPANSGGQPAAGAAGTGTPGGGAAVAAGAGGGSPSAGALKAVPGASRYALVGEEVVLDGTASTGATKYDWFYGNGQGWEAPRAESVARVTYQEPGRYQAVLTVYDATGSQQAATVTITVTHPLTYRGSYSRTMAAIPGTNSAVIVSSDADQLVVVDRDASDAFVVSRRIATCDKPRTVTVWQGFIVTGCQEADKIGLYPVGQGMAVELTLPYGSAPFGVAASESAVFVSLQGPGKLAELRLVDGVPKLHATHTALPDARAVATLPNGRVAVTRWRSPDPRGEIAIVDPAAAAGTAPTLTTLKFDEQVASDAEIGGVPSYLAEFAVSPTGREALIPSLMANHGDGMALSGRPLTFETTVRAALSRVELADNTENFTRRIQFDELGYAGAVAFSSHGDFAYVVMPGNRSIAQVDILTDVDAGAFVDAGFAPDGALVTADDKYLLVNSALSRELVIYGLTGEQNLPTPLKKLPLLETEPLTAELLLGKQLFNDSFDPRLANSGYIACSHCHLDGDSDNRVWDFTDRGEGLRNTISMLGRSGAGDGPIHWSGNFDEVHDFEHDIRGPFGGTGLLSDALFTTGTRNTTLGDKKAGQSADLDALAAYVTSLSAEPKSPFRNPDGTLGAAAVRGKVLFESTALGCTTCHAGARMTDSVFTTPAQPRLHDVGTLTPKSGKRLNMTLSGIDTPTLHGLWASAPYLHDGSAPTLQAVVRERNPQNKHGTTSQLTAAQVDDLVAYLLSLDGKRD